MSSKFDIVVQPESQVLWESWGKNHFNFTTLLCEFIDNSVSNFLAHPKLPNKNINITLRLNNEKDKVEVTIEDNGAGIKDFSDAFSPGKKHRKTDSFLNEHGFGLKNALATANPENDIWEVYSRDKKDFDSGYVCLVKAPWKMTFGKNKFTGERKKIKWPGIYNSSGTFVRFTCERTLFDSVSPRSIKFDRNTIYLHEEISVIYRPFLKDISIKIVDFDHSGRQTERNCLEIYPNTPWNENERTVKSKSLNPFNSFKNPTSFYINNKKVEVNCAFYKYENNSECKKRYKYYKHNVSSQGVEIRSNGRLISYPVFEEIWRIVPDNYYNLFWGVINIKGDPDYLPATSTTKTGYVKNDPLYKEIIEKVGEFFPNQFIPKTSDNRNKKTKPSERKRGQEWLNKLMKFEKFKSSRGEVAVFRELDLKNEKIGSLDALLFDDNDKVVLVENKRDKTKLLDFYQLLMYWDGYVYDKEKSPDKAILLANEHPKWANQIINEINSRKDSNGNKYNFQIKLWSDYDVS